MASNKTKRRKEQKLLRATRIRRSKQKTIHKKKYLGKKEQKELREKLWNNKNAIKKGGNYPTFVTAGFNPFYVTKFANTSNFIASSNDIA